jgi:SsrA-binding protein
MKKLIALNRKARFQYFIEDKFEAGIALQGSEIKSIRQGKANINDAFVSPIKGELYVLNSHIAKYKQANLLNHDEKRYRKLLLHKNEINKIIGKIQKLGFTAVVLRMYFNDKNKVKLEIGTAKGKKDTDKRQVIKEREWQREKNRVLKKSD